MKLRTHLTKLLLVTWFIIASGWSAVRADEPKAGDKVYEIEAVRDLAYYDGEGADKIKHRLDLYLPKDLKDFPVVFFIHGGAWRHGDKSWMGVYSGFGKFCASHGIGAVVTNYRLSPRVAHPEHIKDVAKAFAWTHRNIAKHGGRQEQLFVAGHSAGGHLAALLATDEQYLKAEGLGLDAIRGVIPMSGIYRIPDDSPFFKQAFTDDAKVRKQASPLAHVKPGLPPFLVIYAENDLPYCGKVTSEEFCKALQDNKCTVKSLEAKERNHVSLILKAATEDDPASLALREFVADICKKK